MCVDSDTIVSILTILVFISVVLIQLNNLRKERSKWANLIEVQKQWL